MLKLYAPVLIEQFILPFTHMLYEYSYIWFQNINPYLLVLLGMIGVFIFFLPSFIAIYRSSKDGAFIVIFNILFGWTGIVWLILLIWSLDNPTTKAAT